MLPPLVRKAIKSVTICWFLATSNNISVSITSAFRHLNACSLGGIQQEMKVYKVHISRHVLHRWQTLNGVYLRTIYLIFCKRWTVFFYSRLTIVSHLYTATVNLTRIVGVLNSISTVFVKIGYKTQFCMLTTLHS